MGEKEKKCVSKIGSILCRLNNSVQINVAAHGIGFEKTKGDSIISDSIFTVRL